HNRLRAERHALASEKAELEQRRIDLKTAENAIDAKILRIESLIQQKRDLVERIKKLRTATIDDKLLRLVRLSEKMPPVEAAAYLSKLDESTASRILQGMRVRQASKVMAEFAPKKAASLSKTYLRHDEPVGYQPDQRKSR
ncbi:MAG: hypothetical protein AAFV29_14290, partial [Myxococcota bacterium]